MGRTVLVTGATRHLGSRFLHRLRQERDIDRLVAVDVLRPTRPLDGAEFVQVDIRRPEIGRVLGEYAVDTVVHLDVDAVSRAPRGGRAAVKETNVIGTLQLLGACQKAPRLRRLVVRSSGLVYDSGSAGDGASPALFAESSPPKGLPGGGFAKDLVEIEGYVRGFARRRPDVAVTVLRFAHVLGPEAEGTLADYFRLPVLPTVFGYDPRLQFVHEDDAVEVLHVAAGEPRRGTLNAGTFNIAGDGVMLLSQAARRLGRPTVPVLSPFVGWLGTALRSAGVAGLSSEQVSLLTHGRVMRTEQMREVLGFTPRRTTAEAFADFVHHHGPGLLPPSALTHAVDRIEEALRSG